MENLTDQKRENLLNLALSATEEERLRSENLGIGYDRENQTWELIVRCLGDWSELEALAQEGVVLRRLLAGYAILRLPQRLIPFVTNLKEIEYIEKPKRLFFAAYRARAASCLSGIQPGIGGGGTILEGFGNGLTGAGVIVAVIDSGLDYTHPDFRREDGSTRVWLLWDQDQDRIYTREEINRALEAYDSGGRRAAEEIVPSFDFSGHGTAVAGIAAGNGRAGNGLYRGVAYESELIIVKLGTALAEGFPRTTQLMEGVDFAVRQAGALGRPVAVNLSFGNTYGSHEPYN